MEYFDVLDRNGELKGKILPKGAELGENEYDLGVHVYIYNEKGEYLLQKRTQDKEFRPGAWETHMGHVISGETSKQAMVREIKEEIGLDIEDIHFIKRFRWEKFNHFIDLFAVKADIDLKEIQIGKDEVDDVKFFSKEEMFEFISEMDYRPDEYRIILREFIMNT